MFVFRIVSSDFTETQTESSEVATYWTSRYNKDIRIKSLAWLHAWWPEIDKDIEDYSKACTSCETAAQDPTTTLIRVTTFNKCI